MSAPFDPYHKWFGIPPAQQPPTYYRLLGVEVYEPDREVIDAAANQRTAYLQDLAGGEHGWFTQKLLNEVAAARRCLLNPAAKAEYDQKLRAASSGIPVAVAVPAEFADNTIADAPIFRGGLTVQPIPEVAVPVPIAEPAAPAAVGGLSDFAGLDLTSPVQAPPESDRQRVSPRPEKAPAEDAPKKKPQAGGKLWWIVGGVAFVALVGGAMAMVISGSRSPETAENAVDPKAQSKPTKSKATTPNKKPALPDSPAFHFTPPAGQVLSDICDVVLLGDEYHLFYVSHPSGRQDSAWGHAVSTDMLSWKPASIVFPPKQAPRRTGCVVLDEANSSGLGKKDKPPLVALLRDDTSSKDPPALRLAASTDGGLNWTLDNTTVPLPEGKTSVRSHRVVFHKPTARWLLLVGYAPEPKPEPKAAPKAEPKVIPKTEPKVAPKIEPKVDPKNQPKTRGDSKAAADSKAKVDAKTAADAKAKVDPKGVDPKPKTPEVFARISVYSSKNLRDWEKHPDVELPDAYGLSDVFMMPFNRKADDLRLVVATARSTVKTAAFDGKALTVSDKGPTVLIERAQNVSGMRFFEMTEDRVGVLGVMRQQPSRDGPPPILTLPTELRLLENDAKLHVFYRPFLKEFTALAYDKPEPKPKTALTDENVLESFSPQFEKARGLYQIEFELLTNNQRGKASLKLRGVPVFDVRDQQLRVGGQGTFLIYKNTQKVRIVSDRRSLEVFVGSTSVSIPLPEPTPGDENDASLTGSASYVTNLNVIPLHAPGEPAR